MPRLPLPVISFGALVLLAGFVGGLVLRAPGPGKPETPPEQHIGTAPRSTGPSIPDGPPMDFSGVEPAPAPPTTRTTAPPTSTTTSAAQITSTTTREARRSVSLPKPSVSIPILATPGG